MNRPATGTKHPEQRAIGLELTCEELVGALLALEPARRLHLLDSGGYRGADARLLIAGFDPFEYVEAFGDELHIHTRGESTARTRSGSALALLDEKSAELHEKRRPARLGRLSSPGLGLRGACFVTLSYELARGFQRLRIASARPSAADAPDAVFAFCDVTVVHDYERGATFVVGAEDVSTARLREAADVLNETAAAQRRRSDGLKFSSPKDDDAIARAVRGFALPPDVSSNFTREEYEAAVERIRRHIRAGDIYQANLTQRLIRAPRADVTPERVFLRLRREHPSSFGAFLRHDARTVVSASPERFLRVSLEEPEGRSVEAWPIKGTRRRGVDAFEDARLRAELLASEKDRAENVMIVDLMRNDLGRVCRYGSIEVEELCSLQQHPTLFHLVSKIRGRLRDDVTTGELLRATFPCGSITGAPKLRAMEILYEIEGAARGVSMGSIGYFSFDGTADLNVAIRTLTFNREGAACFHVGGGVVADSRPAAEYDETLVKARALLRALR